MDPGIRIEVFWLDDDLLELRFQASNGRFAATAELYESHSAPSELATGIEDFPTSIDDSREVVLGARDPKFAGGGGVRMCFRCTDLSGHAEVRLEAQQPMEGDAEHESANFSIQIEPAAVDDFVADLRRMRLESGSHARLRGNR